MVIGGVGSGGPEVVSGGTGGGIGGEAGGATGGGKSGGTGRITCGWLLVEHARVSSS